MQCVILAGGLGTRVRSISQGLPKALLPVAGRPFLFHQLDQLVAQHVSDVLLLVGHKGELIREAMASGPAWPLAVHILDEGAELRGTAGALRNAYDQGALAEGFFVLYGDSYLPIPYEPVWSYSRFGSVPVMTVLRNNGQWDRSNAAFSRGLVTRYDKWCPDPQTSGLHYIDYGLSVLTTAAIREYVPPSTTFDLANVFASLSEANELLGFEVMQRFYEIGSPAGLRDLEHYVLTARLHSNSKRS